MKPPSYISIDLNLIISQNKHLSQWAGAKKIIFYKIAFVRLLFRATEKVAKRSRAFGSAGNKIFSPSRGAMYSPKKIYQKGLYHIPIGSMLEFPLEI